MEIIKPNKKEKSQALRPASLSGTDNLINEEVESPYEKEANTQPVIVNMPTDDKPARLPWEEDSASASSASWRGVKIEDIPDFTHKGNIFD